MRGSWGLTTFAPIGLLLGSCSGVIINAPSSLTRCYVFMAANMSGCVSSPFQVSHISAEKVRNKHEREDTQESKPFRLSACPRLSLALPTAACCSLRKPPRKQPGSDSGQILGRTAFVLHFRDHLSKTIALFFP